jgi:long-subunit fatty acid transport protein
MGIFHNPATLLAPTSRTDTTIALHTGFTELCYTRTLVVDDGAGGRSAGATLPEICSDAKASLVPVGASRFRINDQFALGIGVYSPPSVGKDVDYGNQHTGTPNGAMPTSTSSLSSSRYLLMHQHILQVFPTIAAAWAPLKRLRVGASFGWGYTSFKFSNAVFSRAVSMAGPPEIGGASDVGNYVSGKDTFTPRVQVGVWGQPVDALPLELGASFTYTGNVETDDAKLRVKNLYTEFYPAALTGALGLQQPGINQTYKNTGVTVPAISVLQLGARYAKKLARPVGKGGDRLATERFDIELNLIMSFAERMKSVDVRPPADAVVDVPGQGAFVPALTLQLPDEIKLPHRWQNQYGIRIGGDYNVIPGMLALRAGYSFESNGVKDGYHQLDFQPWQRFGFMLGATVRIIDMIDISASYAYFVIPDVKNSVQDAGVPRVITGDARPADAEIANAGTLTQTAQALVVEVGMHL